jgi:hypothetical protein
MPSNQKQKNSKWLKWRKGISWSNFLFLPFVVLSTIFWLSTKLSNELQYRKQIHIIYETDDDMVLKNDLSKVLNAQLVGQGWDLIFLKSYSEENPFVYKIDRNARFINKSDLINRLNIDINDQNIKVEDLNFSDQPLQLEPKLSKKVPIVFDGDLEFASFYKLDGNKVVFDPDSARITGPESMVKNMVEIPCVRQEIKDIQKDIQKTVLLARSQLHYIQIDPLEVEMIIRAEQLTQKSITVPVRVANPDYDSQVNIVPADIEINFLIGLSEFQQVSKDDFSAQIIIPEDRIPNQQYAVSIVKKPGNAVIQEISPAYVDVFFAN